jgi:hypothetical protein
MHRALLEGSCNALYHPHSYNMFYFPLAAEYSAVGLQIAER